METLPVHPPGPVADKLSIWPLDSGQYGLDATLVQELGDAWTLRFGPLSAKEVTMALRSFVH